MKRKRTCVLMLLGGQVLAGVAPAADPLAGLDRCNVVWTSPSENAHGSMPLGNGDVGINAWVEPSGDLVFFVSKTDAWNENANLCKIGRVRVKFDPPLAVKDGFKQELKLRDGVIEIQSKIQNQTSRILLWVDADQPVVRIEAETVVPVGCRAEVDLWRLRELPMSVMDDYGDGSGANDPKAESSKPAKRQQLAVSVLAERADTPDAWLKDLEKLERAALQPAFEQSRLTTAKWWQAFWNRSWVLVDAKAGAAEGKAPANANAAPAAPPELTRGYVLQRFMNAGSGRGASPIKFNGSIFTVEKQPGASPETPEGNPDWRCWGGSYWFQNTRLSYWPMLASGDFEMMEPWFRMYREALPLSKARMQEIYKFTDAASFQETMNFWGMPNNRDYGWSHSGPEPGNVCIHRYWSGGMELTAIMLDRHDFTGDEDFVRDTLVPLADPIIAFFDQYWQKRDADGKIVFDPAQSLEALPWTVNPMPEIAGLHFILPRLQALPEKLTTEAQRSRWARILRELPPLPVAAVDGVKLLRPSGTFAGGNYSENPELYAVFPYRLFGVGKPDLEMARATYQKRVNRTNFGWCQDSIQAACLGLGEEAGRLVVTRATSHRAYRFPAMWVGFDWIPDQDHGVNILTTLQCMLLQHDGGKIYLFPAWPKDWDVSFKLHAPRNTTVEGVYRAGKLENLKVTPASRRGELVNMLGS